jgi:AcrR family transcriptional regulator
MKRQKQIDESKEMITEAFIRLMRDHDYDELTLSQIAQEARVNRMTLYRHFGSKEKIVLYRAQKYLQEERARTKDQQQPFHKLLHGMLERVKNLPHLGVLLKNRGH